MILKDYITNALCYRDGRGVAKDVDKAIELLRSVKEESSWACKELVKILRSRNNSSDYCELFELYKTLSEAGDVNFTVNLAQAYRDGRGVAKDVDKAIELLRSVKEESSWACKELIKTSLDVGIVQPLTEIDFSNNIPAMYTHDYKLYCERNESTIIATIYPNLDDSITVNFELFCNGHGISKKVCNGGCTTFDLHQNGLYYVHAYFKKLLLEVNINSPTMSIGQDDCSNNITEVGNPQDYYFYNYPFLDYFVVLSNYELDFNDLKKSFTIQSLKLGNKFVYVLCHGLPSNLEINEIFSGLGIINDKFVYGYEDLDSFDYGHIFDSVGNYTHVKINENEVKIDTDYLGIGKIYYYMSGNSDISIFSNRYHLLLLIMKFLNVSTHVNNDVLKAALFLKQGMYSEQPSSNELLASDTRLISPHSHIIVNSSGVVFENNTNFDIPDEIVSDEEYKDLLLEVKNELIHNMNLVLESNRFSEYKVDVTGGCDSRLVIAILSNINTKKKIFVDTSGTNEVETICASHIASTAGYNYSPEYIAYRKISGGYCVPVEGSLDLESYLDLISSLDLGTYDSSLMPTMDFEGDTLHLAGWCGECARPTITKKVLKVPLFKYDTPYTYVRRFILSRSGNAMDSYDIGQSLINDLSNAISEKWDTDINYASDLSFTSYRLRFHDDFSKECSYSIPAWAPLLSKKFYETYLKTIKFDSYKYYFDILFMLNPNLTTYRYESWVDNVTRVVLLRDKLICPDSDYDCLKYDDVPSKDYSVAKIESNNCKILINGEDVSNYILPSYEMNNLILKRTKNLLNYCKTHHNQFNYAAYDRMVSDMSNNLDIKLLIPLYKKLNSIVQIDNIFNKSCNNVHFKEYIPLKAKIIK